jgi:hypothetical protein
VAQEAIDRARRGTDQQVAVFAEFGVELRREVFDQVVPRCDRARDRWGRRLALDPGTFHRDILQMELLHVPADDVAVGINRLEFDAHLALAILGPDEAPPRKIGAMQRYQAGEDPADITAGVMQGVAFRFTDLSHWQQPRKGSHPS